VELEMANTAFRGVALAPIVPRSGLLHATGELGPCTTKCQIAQADDALEAVPFDKVACEVGAAKSCREKYDAAGAKLESAMICPPCLGPAARSSAAGAARTLLDRLQPEIYCAGTMRCRDSRRRTATQQPDNAGAQPKFNTSVTVP